MGFSSGIINKYKVYIAQPQKMFVLHFLRMKFFQKIILYAFNTYILCNISIITLTLIFDEAPLVEYPQDNFLIFSFDLYYSWWIGVVVIPWVDGLGGRGVGT